MTWTYDIQLMTPVDQVRFLIGDTNEDEQQVQDEELTWLLSQTGGDPYEAAARAAIRLAGKFSRLASKSVGDLSITYKDLFTNYSDLAKELRGMRFHGVVTMAPYAGGISRSDKEEKETDSDRVRPTFKRGMTDNPSAASPDHPDPFDSDVVNP